VQEVDHGVRRGQVPDATCEGLAVRRPGRDAPEPEEVLYGKDRDREGLEGGEERRVLLAQARLRLEDHGDCVRDDECDETRRDSQLEGPGRVVVVEDVVDPLPECGHRRRSGFGG